MNRVFLYVLVVVVVAMHLSVAPARAQAPGLQSGNVGFNAAVARLFSEVPTFSAAVETTLTNQTDKTWMRVPMRMMKHQDRFRLEVDLQSMAGAGEYMAQIGGMRMFGMSRMTSLVLPEEKGMVLLFPDLKAWTRVSLSETDFPTAGFKLTKRKSGTEKINGQECVRHRVQLEGGDKSKIEATTWEAPALGNFPVRMLFKPEGSTVMMDFTGITLAPPAENLFKAPSDYREFSSFSSLMQEALSRVGGAGGVGK